MPQAIQTKALPATNTRPMRVKAICEGGSVTLPWADETTHRDAAIALARKLGWRGRLVGGGLPDGSKVWVFDVPTVVNGVHITAATCTDADGRVLDTQEQRRARNGLSNMIGDDVVA